MNKTTEALKLAEEALDEVYGELQTDPLRDGPRCLMLTQAEEALAAIREALAESKPAPDGRIPKTVFTLDDISKAAEMGRQAGMIDALADHIAASGKVIGAGPQRRDMEKLKVTLQDRPIDDELAQYKRMFEAACSALAAIGDALGVDPEEGGAEPILAAIADIKDSALQHVNQEPYAYEFDLVGVDKVGYPILTKDAASIARMCENPNFSIKPLYSAPLQPVKQEPVAKVTDVIPTRVEWLREVAVNSLLYAAPVSAEAIRAEALEEAAKLFETNGANMMTKAECAAAIRGLK